MHTSSGNPELEHLSRTLREERLPEPHQQENRRVASFTVARSLRRTTVKRFLWGPIGPGCLATVTYPTLLPFTTSTSGTVPVSERLLRAQRVPVRNRKESARLPISITHATTLFSASEPVSERLLRAQRVPLRNRREYPRLPPVPRVVPVRNDS